jgi:hypothetical protein
MRLLNYNIGHVYKYPEGGKFVLAEKRNFTFHFKCGHWCTDNVFIDLMDVTKGIKVAQDTQLNLFENHANL